MESFLRRLIIISAIVAIGIHIPLTCIANDKVSFIVAGYYFELLLGQKYLWDSNGFEYDYYLFEKLQKSHVVKEHFKHITRVELPKNDQKYEDLEMDFPANAEEAWNPSKKLILVTFSERAMIMSLDYCILKCYGNVELAKWINDYEIFANVETGNPGLYDREDFIINIETDVVRDAPKELKENSSKQ